MKNLLKYGPKKQAEKRDPVVLELERARDELSLAYKNFNSVTQDELLDFYTYQLKAAEIKYSYLIKCVR